MYIYCHTGLENLRGLPAQVRGPSWVFQMKGIGAWWGVGGMVAESWMAVSEPGGRGDRSSWRGAVAESSCLGVTAYAGPPRAFWNPVSLRSQKARQAGTSLETGTYKNPMVGSVRSAHCPGLSGPVHLSLTLAPQTPPTPGGYYPPGHSALQPGFTRRIHSTFGPSTLWIQGLW